MRAPRRYVGRRIDHADVVEAPQEMGIGGADIRQGGVRRSILLIDIWVYDLPSIDDGEEINRFRGIK
jgi:hypothetical protein